MCPRWRLQRPRLSAVGEGGLTRGLRRLPVADAPLLSRKLSRGYSENQETHHFGALV